MAAEGKHLLWPLSILLQFGISLSPKALRENSVVMSWENGTTIYRIIILNIWQRNWNVGMRHELQPQAGSTEAEWTWSGSTCWASRPAISSPLVRRSGPLVCHSTDLATPLRHFQISRTILARAHNTLRVLPKALAASVTEQSRNQYLWLHPMHRSCFSVTLRIAQKSKYRHKKF